jgi:glucose-1-phosphate cytidylyltransferase
MKVIILAGGWGTRLGTETEEIPKPMVQIGNKPILWHIMKIYSHYGYKSFIISAGVKAEAIKKYFYDYELCSQNYTKDFSTGEVVIHDNAKDIDWQVSVIDTGLDTLKGARIKRLEKYLDGPTHMVTYGDGISDIDINKLVKFHKDHGKTITISGVHPPSRFGEMIEKEGQVVSFEEKPQTSVGMINGGFMVFNINLLDYLTTDEDCDFEFNALEKLATQGEVMVFKHEGNWECLDHERDLVHLNKLWKEKKAPWKVWES